MTAMPMKLGAAVLALVAAASAAQENSRAEKLEAARDIIETVRYGALATVDVDGQPRVRTVDPFPPTEDMTVWIATHPSTRKLAQIRANPRVTLYYTDPERAAYVTLMGRARIHEDAATKAKWKHPDVERFYPDYPEDYALIEVVPERLEVLGRGIDADPRTWRPQSVRFER